MDKIMTIWFSSDHHFHHKNIIEYGDRPFKHVDEMKDFIIETHNAYVKPSDHWYCLGDVTMERDNQGRGLWILDKMHGHKRLIMGNHDHYHVKHYMIHFEKVMAMQRMDKLWFTHVPVHPNSLGSVDANVHGHIHQNPSYPPVERVDEKGVRRKQFYINISVEATNYKPVSLEELKQQVRILKGERV